MKIKEKYKLRKPSGHHTVGSSYFAYEYTPEEQDGQKRLLPCMCWYPAQGIGDGTLKKYVSERILPGTGGIETNAYVSAPPAEGKHPLILFNHGFSLGYESNTAQCEELASHGYIVLSIGHLGDGSYELPNGELVMFDMEKMMQEYQVEVAVGGQIWTQYERWLNGEGKTASLQAHREHYQTIIDAQPRMVAQTDVWIKDSLAALDLFLADADQESAMLHQHIDHEKIGALGMSFGGSTALSLAQQSDRIMASADLDGFLFSPSWQTPIGKPILLMQHDGLGGYFLTFPFLNADRDAYLATIKNTTHGNFADYNELIAENPVSKGILEGEEVEYSLLGKIDPDEMERIMNTLLVDFFNKYLKGQPSQVIDSDDLPEDVILLRK